MAWPAWLKLALDAAAVDDDPERAKQTTNMAFARWREELLQSGMCIQGCGLAKSERSTLYCEKHHIRSLARNERRRNANIEAGKCTACGTRPNDGETYFCTVCREANKARDKVRYANKRAAGLCAKCGEPSSRFAMCKPCRAKDRENSLERQRDLRSRGICVTCGEEPTQQRRCKVCAERFNAGRRVARVRNSEEAITAAMRLVIDREAEYFATGVKVVDAEYLEARELVMRRAI